MILELSSLKQHTPGTSVSVARIWKQLSWALGFTVSHKLAKVSATGGLVSTREGSAAKLTWWLLAGFRLSRAAGLRALVPNWLLPGAVLSSLGTSQHGNLFHQSARESLLARWEWQCFVTPLQKWNSLHAVITLFVRACYLRRRDCVRQ